MCASGGGLEIPAHNRIFSVFIKRSFLGVFILLTVFIRLQGKQDPLRRRGRVASVIPVSSLIVALVFIAMTSPSLGVLALYDSVVLKETVPLRLLRLVI